MKAFFKVLRDQRGATAIEYAMIAVLISVAAVAALNGIGTQLNSTLSYTQTKMVVQ